MVLIMGIQWECRQSENCWNGGLTNENGGMKPTRVLVLQRQLVVVQPTHEKWWVDQQ